MIDIPRFYVAPSAHGSWLVLDRQSDAVTMAATRKEAREIAREKNARGGDYAPPPNGSFRMEDKTK